MLMSKNVNNDVSKDSPIGSPVVEAICQEEKDITEGG